MAVLTVSADRFRTPAPPRDLPQAEQHYRQRLQANPGDAEAWLLLGEALRGQGKFPEAAASYQRALHLNPVSADSHFGLGLALASQGQRPEAIRHYRQALHHRPEHLEALTNLGITLAEQGQLDEATACLRQALRQRPESAQAHHNLGVALAQQGRPAEAAASLEQALRLRPDYPEACYNLGIVLQELGRRDEALECFRQVLQRKPDQADACTNLGLGLTETGQLAEAVVVLQQAVRLRPQMKEAHNNLGLAYAELGQFERAEESYQQALRLDPGFAEAHCNLGSTCKEQGRLEEALAHYQHALRLAPDSASAQYNRALALLQKGDYERGWPAYEWRWKRKRARNRPFREPRWDGSPLAGRTIVLWMEQGLGDAIHFLRYAPLVQRRGARVIVECPGFMVPLFSTCAGIDRLVAEGETLPPFDVQVPVMSLPALLGTTLATVPAEVPYLHAEPGRAEFWRRKLGGAGQFRVGIVWQGNPYFQWDRHRSIPLSCFAPLAAVEGVRLYSLQKGTGTEQLRSVSGRFAVTEWGEELDAEGGAFLDTAAVMANLDLVVTADTAAAHLAGALGVPVWVALSRIADWRWMCQRDDTPWYPTMRFFRQTTLGDWATVFERMARELRRRVNEARRGRVVAVDLSPGELIDRLTRLEARRARVVGPEEQARIQGELAALKQRRDEEVPRSEELAGLERALGVVNERLDEAEAERRRCARHEDFGPRFVELARAVCRGEDERADLQRRINEVLGSTVSREQQPDA